MKEPSKAPRIHDVARLAGVSVATVSRVFSNPSIVAERTRLAVEKAVEETGYTVNFMARNLRQQQVGAVLALVPRLANPFFSVILAGISSVLRPEGLNLLVLDTRPDGGADGAERTILPYLNRSRCDGVIVLDGGLDAGVFDRPGCPPVVQACEWIDGLGGSRVSADNAEGARLAVEHLLAIGHRGILHLTGPARNTLTQARATGVAQALASRPDATLRRMEGDFSLRSGHEAAGLIAALPDRPGAVFCDNDEMAIGLIQGLVQNGLSVPGDISVVGFDNIESSAYALPPLTTVSQKRARLGHRAAELLLSEIRDGPSPVDEVLPVELIIRGSTAPSGEGNGDLSARSSSAMEQSPPG